MKKIIVIVIAVSAIGSIVTLATLIYSSFSKIKPAAETINKDLAAHFKKIVRIPELIPPPIQNFEETAYFWEMETIENEVIGVRFKHTTGFAKDQKTIIATLEMSENGDPSIFTKVLPAIIVDKQSLDSALDVKKANFSPNEEAGYKSFKLAVDQKNNQTIKISWEFEKSKLNENLLASYAVLAKHPQQILELLYNIPKFAQSLFAG